MRVFKNIFFSLVLLVSTVGITVSSHYCMGHLKDQKVFGQADVCSQESPMPMGCCEDITDLYQLDEDVNFQVQLNVETPHPPPPLCDHLS